MNGEAVALDTNAAIGFLAGEAGWVNLLRLYGRVCMPVVVLGELRYGALNSARPEANLAAIDALVRGCSILGIDDATAVVYAGLRHGLKRRGRPIPENDVWIAAVCVQHGVGLASLDGHFREVESLVVVGPKE